MVLWPSLARACSDELNYDFRVTWRRSRVRIGVCGGTGEAWSSAWHWHSQFMVVQHGVSPPARLALVDGQRLELKLTLATTEQAREKTEQP